MTAKRLGISGGRLAICTPPPLAQVFAVSVHLDITQARAALGG